MSKAKNSNKYEFQIQARNFHIVANKASLPHLNDIIKYFKTTTCRYLLCRIGLNKRSEEHAHIYVNYSKPRMINNKKTFGCHIAKCRGTPRQNIDYIKGHHPTEVLEFGAMPKDIVDKKAQWMEFTEDLKEGKVDKYSPLYARYQHYADRMIMENTHYFEYTGKLKDKNIWIWGPPRTGKTYWCKHCDDKPWYTKKPNKWWDGYKGQRKVIIDDIPKDSQYLAYYIKEWGDRGPYDGEIKGGTIPLDLANMNIMVSAQYHPRQVFSKSDAEAICKRFYIWHITEKMPNVPDEELTSDDEDETLEWEYDDKFSKKYDQ